VSAERHTRYQAVILRDDDTMLLVRCLFSDGRDWWMIPGGGREDETEEECIVREVREETALDVRVERLLVDLPADPPDGTYVRWRSFLCRVLGGEAAPGGGEGSNARLVDTMWLPLFDECAWPDVIADDPFLVPQLHAFRAALLPPLDAVIFDLDDTLLDRRATIDTYLAGSAKRLGLTADVAAAYRTRFIALDNAGYTPRATVFGALATEFPMCGSSESLTADWIERAFSECRFMENATEVIARCKQAGYRTGIITNGPSGMQRAKLKSLGLEALVDVVIVSGEEGMHKPAAELFHRAAERLRVAPSRCLYVGDNPVNDVGGATGAGMQAIWLQTDMAWPDEMPRPRHSIRSLGTLVRLLQTNRD
jgi:putative hydrolase of the HAD superfamily